MVEQWLPLLAAAGDLDTPFAAGGGVGRVGGDECGNDGPVFETGPGQDADQGVSTTKPHRCCGTRSPSAPAPRKPHGSGVIEADTVAHCGPTLIGEFARTLTMTDLGPAGPRTPRSATTPLSGSSKASRSCRGVSVP